MEEDEERLSPEDIIEKGKNIDFQCWFGVVLGFCKKDGTFIHFETPNAIGFMLSLLKTVQGFMVSCETNSDGVPHYHVLMRTMSRSDAIRRSIEKCFNTTKLAFMSDIGDPDPILNVLKIQKVHKPTSLAAYIVKDPLWILSDKTDLLTYLYNLWEQHAGERFLLQKQEKNRRKQVLGPDLIGAAKITEEVLTVIYDNQCKTVEDVFRANPQIVVQYLHKPGFTGIINNCLSFVTATQGEWSFKNNADRREGDPSEIHRVLSHQEIDIASFDYHFWKWITKNSGKKNTFVLFGPSNTGKSAFINGLKGIFDWGEICNGSIFCFEQLVDKKLGIWEEPLISSEGAEKFKQISEGMICSVPIKYKKPVKLQRIPILVTTNHALWRFCSHEEDAFKNRMYIFPWNQSTSDGYLHFRSWDPGCKCSSCKRGQCSEDVTNTRTISSMSREEQSIQSMGRGDQYRCNMGNRSPRSLPGGTDSGNQCMEGTSGEFSGVHYTQLTISTSRSESSSTISTGFRSSTCSTTSDSMGSCREYRSSYSSIRIQSGGCGDAESMESRQHRRSDDENSGGIRSNGDRSGHDSISGGTRRKHSEIQELELVLEQTPKKTRNTMETQQCTMGEQMVTMKCNPPGKKDWEEYLSYLYKVYSM